MASKSQDAMQRIESHEKLCRIMQKQTYERMQQMQSQITRIERILLVSMGAVMTGMGGVIVVLLQKL
jgi:cell division protein FtsL|tara:strand:+ start:1386 stop:1586 length:201 start_codon:yes stop_codon:yes gene_type:complete